MLLGTSARAEGPAAGGEFINVRQLGATGDGKTDDTKAFQRALDAAGETHGAVFVPAGVYICAELQMHPNTALVGVPTWDYRSTGGTVIRLLNPGASCLLNITGAWGSTVDGLALDGRNLGKGVNGIFLNKPTYGKREDAFRIERCQVRSFSGDGLNLTRAWCFSVRHSMLAGNQGDGLRLRGWDGFLVDNWFSGNHGAGYGALAGFVDRFVATGGVRPCQQFRRRRQFLAGDPLHAFRHRLMRIEIIGHCLVSPSDAVKDAGAPAGA